MERAWQRREELGLMVVEEVIATADPPPTGVANPIHDAAGAAAAGYAGALVAGVRSYGWAAQAVARALGERWLADGWVDFSLRRPLYAGEPLRTEVTAGRDSCTIACLAGRDETRTVLDGTAGLGRAPWLEDLDPPAVMPGSAPPEVRPTYTLDDVPLHQPLRPLVVQVSREDALRMVLDDLALDLTDERVQRDPALARYCGDGGEPMAVHPYFLAGRMAPLTRHNYTYGPTIHVRSQIQHLRAALAGRELVVGAQIVDAYERNGHWCQVLDGVVSDPEGEVARIRHHTIFRPRGT